MEDLENYERRRLAIRNLEERIEVLRQRFESTRGARLDGTGYQPGTAQVEEALVENIAERERLQENLTQAKRMVQVVERGLAALPEEKRRVLEHFYKRDGQGKAIRASLEMHVDRATVYRMRDEALREFTLAMYGVVES